MSELFRGRTVPLPEPMPKRWAMGQEAASEKLARRAVLPLLPSFPLTSPSCCLPQLSAPPPSALGHPL